MVHAAAALVSSALAADEMPVGQLVQDVAPLAEYEPAEHDVHDAAPAAENVPAEQVKHCEAPAAEYFPAEQIVQPAALVVPLPVTVPA